MTNDATRHCHIAIAGTGFSGLGAAILLKQSGIDDFTLFERAEDVGGTWRDNSYPGCACDVESHLYSFSFAPNPEWSRLFSPQPEIFAYLRKCAHDYGIVPHVRFGHEVQEARWNEDAQRWFITTSRGVYTADILLGGMGALSEPSIPKLPGLESFQGKAFHSAQWDHSYDLTGKRVLVVGTGASAIQFVPAIQPHVQKLTLVQRTPAWVMPRLDRAVSEREKALFRKYPAAQQAVRSAIYLRRELFVLGLKNPRVMPLLEKFALSYLERCVPDPELRKKLTPDFRLGCKRVLISRDYLRSLTKPNVEVVTHGIKEVRASSVVLLDGSEHEVDAIIFGTGFHVTDMPFANRVFGKDGRSLNELWQGSPHAHLGATVPGFPNLFLLLGPNTGLGHTSVVIMIEAQLRMVVEAIKQLRARGNAILEVRREVEHAYNQRLDARLDGTVWNAGGCQSWYLDRNGRNSTLWPSFTFEFMRAAKFRPEEYVMTRRRSRAERPERARKGSLARVLPFAARALGTKKSTGKVSHG